MSLTTLKRLQRLEQARGVDVGVGGWGPLLGVDEWEALAVRMQEELVRFTEEMLGDGPHAGVVNAADLPDPDDVTHRYKPSATTMFGTVVKRID